MKYAIVLAMTLVLAGCDSGEPDEVTVRDEGATVGAEIASDYNRQMDRAQNVEIQLEDHRQNLDDAIEKQTNPDQ